jgi:uncharacterized protein (TIGR03000 family)
MFKRLFTGAAAMLLCATPHVPAQLSTGYYGGGDYRTLYSYYPDRPVQWPGSFGYSPRPLVRETIVYYPASQSASLPPPTAPVTIDVVLPEGADLWIEGKKMGRTTAQRKFISPPLESGRRFNYEFRIRFKDEGRDQTKSRSLDVYAGGHYTVDFVNPPKTPGRIDEFPPAKKKKFSD